MTDHKTDAESDLASANNADWQENWVAFNLAQAQVHATLALTEQLRVANLIAFMQSEVTLLPAPRSYGDEFLEGVRAQITEGLGI